ncbi:MAG: signal peptidase I [Phycisphaeraceae bacterium]
MSDEGNDNTPGPTPTKKILTPSCETKPAGDAKGKKSKKDRPEPTTFGGKLWYHWVKPIGSVIIVVVVFRSMLFDWNDVPTGSMEPEVHVGDRIAVNRLAYGLQFPLTGPQIGIPFIGPQFDNPLDGVPQIAWGNGPARGDIVTFWNPVTKVRMVKRIVAVPGDTIEMTGGELIINGERATYQDVPANPPTMPVQTKWAVEGAMGRTQYKTAEVAYREETILGETRVVQHIKDRWQDGVQLVELNNGTRGTLSGGVVTAVDFLSNRRAEQVPLAQYLNNNPQPTVFAEMRNGAIYIDGERASFSDLAEAMLAGFADGSRADLLAKAGLSVDGHTFQVEGKAVSMDIFETRFKTEAPSIAKTDAEKQIVNQMHQTLNFLGNATMTNYGPVTLGEDEYLMIGDNRNNSHDGRRFGPVDRGEITGEAFAVAFSFEDNKMFALPPDPAWNRFFKGLD